MKYIFQKHTHTVQIQDVEKPLPGHNNRQEITGFIMNIVVNKNAQLLQ